MAAILTSVTISSLPSQLPLQHRRFRNTVKFSPSWFRFQAVNGDPPQAQSPEDKGKLALEELDQQLSTLSERSTPAPRPVVDPRMEPQKKRRNEEDLPKITDGFLLFVGVGLLLLTFVNNVLFYKFIAPQPQEAAKSSSSETEMDYQKVIDNKIEMPTQPADEQ